MKSYKTLILAAAFALCAAISLTIVYAQSSKDRPDFQMNGRDGAPHPPPPPGGGLHPRMLSRLNLTDAQKEQIRNLHEGARTASEAHMEKARAAQDQLKAVVEAATFDEAAARSLLAVKSQAMIEMDVIRLRTDSAIYNLLTAEQKTQLEKLKQERPEFHRRGGPRPDERPQEN